jgi:3-hydroxybutyrate dehydrogenase
MTTAPRYALEDRVVLITGAAGGIGRALAAAFAAQGAQLVTPGSCSASRLN